MIWTSVVPGKNVYRNENGKKIYHLRRLESAKRKKQIIFSPCVIENDNITTNFILLKYSVFRHRNKSVFFNKWINSFKEASIPDPYLNDTDYYNEYLLTRQNEMEHFKEVFKMTRFGKNLEFRFSICEANSKEYVEIFGSKNIVNSDYRIWNKAMDYFAMLLFFANNPATSFSRLRMIVNKEDTDYWWNGW